MIKNCIKLAEITNITVRLGLIRVQVRSGLNIDPEDAILLNTWGSNAAPNKGDFVVVFAVNDDPNYLYAIPFNIHDAVRIAQGEKIIYNTQGNTKVHLKQNGDIDIEALSDSLEPSINISATTALNVTAPNINITGNVNITGDLSVTGDSTLTGDLEVTGDSTLTGSGTTITGKSFLSHTHSGVQSGASNTGGVV